MSFIWPSMLFALAALPLLVLIYLRLLRRRRRMLAAYGALGFGAASAATKRAAAVGARRHLPPLLFLAGLAILVVALARPRAVVNIPRLQGTVILAFDVSGSMAATDLEPNRMEAAKVAARAFVDRQPEGVLIGVVAFSDNGFSVQAPTDDSAVVLSAINRLAPARGTSLGQGIAAALTTITAANAEGGLFYSDRPVEPTATPTAVPIGSFAPAAIVLLSDGENNQRPEPLEVALAAAERGVRIYTVGIGSPGGATLQVEGFSVHTQLDEQLLQQIALVTGGEYYQASTAEALLAVYQQLNPQLLLKAEHMEVTSLFAGAGVVIFLLAGLLSLVWFGRLP
jgi:Ca-activated chloride channel family protein